MNLSGSQRQQLQEALIDAFPDKASLEQMLSFQLGKNLSTITSEGNLSQVVFKLITQSEAENWVEDLIHASQRANCGNEKLKHVAESLVITKPDITSRTIYISDTNAPDVDEYCIKAQELIRENFSDKWDVIVRQDLCSEDIPSVEQCSNVSSCCGIFISILGIFYGTVNKASNLSYAEYELKVAQDANKQIICFILMTEELPAGIPTKYILEQNLLLDQQQELRKYIESQTSSLIIKFVSSLEDFRESLQTYLYELEQPTNKVSPKSLISKNIPFLGNYPHLNYDRRPVSASKLEELDAKLIDNFLGKPLAQRVLRRKGILRISTEEHLQRLGVLHYDTSKPTLGAFLCFGSQLLLADKFAAGGLQMSVFQGEKRGSSNASPEFIQDNLLNLFEIGIRFLSVEAGLQRIGQSSVYQTVMKNIWKKYEMVIY